MLAINFWAVVVAAVAGLVLSSVWYIAFDKLRRRVSDVPEEPKQRWVTPVVELARNLVLGTVLAGLITALDLTLPAALLLGLALWVGFPLVLFAGAVLHEGTPWQAAAIHMGDWLVKILAISAIVALWR